MRQRVAVGSRTACDRGAKHLKKPLWIFPLIIALSIIGYALAKAAQYNGQWKQFQAAWQNVTPHVRGTPGYSWTPGVFSAAGEMDFSTSQLSDEDLQKVIPLLRGVETLTILNLSNSQVTDLGIQPLGEFNSLEKLHLSNTGVSEDAVNLLREELVHCTIVH